ncbi:DUF3999 domain-containing protein [Marinihelvus fidelis]|uniref:DUF3999 domain-containing protein n=1 Tax=Marinihelvus fidelis TaxID=2613842 RepID=A0A5N0TGA2_9GAMM|nr:DUF3999 family protein [Marinihelvus fidelis]KAA9134115.1 DUF3999 domain-containing protein [Marinihelvus fidelis]
MTVKPLLTLLLAGLAAMPAPAVAQVPARDDYAWHFPVEVTQAGEYQVVDIPLAVYRSAHDASLRDLGIYNGVGQAVPRIIERPGDDAEVLESLTPLGVIPLYGEVAESQRRLNVLMQLDEPGTTLQFRSVVPEPTEPGQQLQALIVDLREHEERISGLAFTWSGAADGFIGTVIVEQGDDLADWRPLARGTLAELAFEEARIEENRVGVDGPIGDYLRVTWRDMPAGWRPATITAIRHDRGPAAERDWLELEPREAGEDGREFTFDAGGYLPVDRLELVLPGGNGVVRAAVYAREGSEGPWRHVHEGVFYRVNTSGTVLQSGAGAIVPSRADHWRVRVLSGQVNGAPVLRLGWRPERLLFLAQGDGPFTLATGRARDQGEQFPQQRLLGDNALFSMLGQAGEPSLAVLGARQAGAGEIALAAEPDWSWKTVLVWIGLFAAVGIVGYLVLSLLRESDATKVSDT